MIAILVASWAAACSASSSSKRPPAEREFTLFVTTELRGSIEPCGCNSDPMGDLARTAEQVAAARRAGRPVLVVDGGSLLYSEAPVPEHLLAQETLKAELIADVYTSTLKVTAVGLGPYDVGRGWSGVAIPRQAANLPADSGLPVEPPKVVTVGGARVGVFGVVAPAALSSAGIQVGDPEPAAREAVAGLREQGAELVIGLAHMTRTEATALARRVPGIDILVIGQGAPEPDTLMHAPMRGGDTYLVQPANRGQVVTRLDVTMRAGGPLIDAVGEARAAQEIARLGERIAELETKLAAWKQDPTADKAFVAAQEQELGSLRKERDALAATPMRVPDQGSYFVLEQIPIKKRLPCHAQVQEAKIAYDKAAGKANVAAAAGKKAPPPAPGQAGYMGVEECSMCHAEAVAFWRKTRHFQAWETLERVGKESSLECIYCHVTGWEAPGGATLADNEHLRDVQCEVCHGPGSIHVDNDGAEDPTSVVRQPPQTLCVTCHNQEHSDTFQLEAYLRDVTGPGHGAKFRDKLGDGPTGRELRATALDKAGKDIGAGCKK